MCEKILNVSKKIWNSAVKELHSLRLYITGQWQKKGPRAFICFVLGWLLRVIVPEALASVLLYLNDDPVEFRVAVAAFICRITSMCSLALALFVFLLTYCGWKDRMRAKSVSAKCEKA